MHACVRGSQANCYTPPPGDSFSWMWLRGLGWEAEVSWDSRMSTSKNKDSKAFSFKKRFAFFFLSVIFPPCMQINSKQKISPNVPCAFFCFLTGVCGHGLAFWAVYGALGFAAVVRLQFLGAHTRESHKPARAPGKSWRTSYRGGDEMDCIVFEEEPYFVDSFLLASRS